MSQICILFRGSSNYIKLDFEHSEMGNQVFADLHNAKLNKKSILLLTGANGYSRFIEPRAIIDCYINHNIKD